MCWVRRGIVMLSLLLCWVCSASKKQNKTKNLASCGWQPSKRTKAVLCPGWQLSSVTAVSCAFWGQKNPRYFDLSGGCLGLGFLLLLCFGCFHNEGCYGRHRWSSFQLSDNPIAQVTAETSPQRSTTADVHTAFVISPWRAPCFSLKQHDHFSQPFCKKCQVWFLENWLWYAVVWAPASFLGWAARNCISPLLLLGVWVAVVAVASCFFERNKSFLSNKAKCFLLVDLNAFYCLTKDLRGGCVHIWKKNTVWNKCCLDGTLTCLKLHAEILIYIFLVFSRCYFQTREWCQIPAIPTSLLGHRSSLAYVLNYQPMQSLMFHIK